MYYNIKATNKQTNNERNQEYDNGIIRERESP
jgi:hypothetical protein